MPAAQPVAVPTGPPQGFSGMQASMMEGGAMPQQPAQPMPQPAAPPPQMPAQPPTGPPQMPAAQPEPQKEEPEEEMATIQPSLPVAQLAYNRTNIEEIESLIESVVEEKWRQAMESFEDFNIWKEKARTEIISVKQELLRLGQRFENMEKAMIGRVHEYDTHVLNIGAEIKAIEKVLQKIMQPLSENIRELDKITKKLKK